ncbi:hypothetical protein RRG08_007235 [Elysia crispata]|uniref:Uncharacterized protein n=1 Tax=Elysia crispata TaxID=231223 RepID=A0AAE0ZTS1_9GAST|nr:hypothetical protein RRG08_007235 [Elysia crispata]
MEAPLEDRKDLVRMSSRRQIPWNFNTASEELASASQTGHVPHAACYCVIQFRRSSNDSMVANSQSKELLLGK